MISFIIPTLNEELYLEDTLKNLSRYSGSHEIIISDGGSTDNTIEIARKYTDHIVLHKKSHRQTIPEGRNAGAFTSRGSYIVEIDADTRFTNIDDFFQILISRFENNKKLVAATTWFRVYPDKETIPDRLVYGLTGFLSLFINNYLEGGATSGGEFQMMRRDAFMQVNGYDEKLIAMEDNDLFIRMSKLGLIHFANDLVIYHSARRAHKIGWHAMIWDFIKNSISLALFQKTASKVWTVIR